MGRGYNVLLLTHSKGKGEGARLRIVKNEPAFNREDWARLLAIDEFSPLCGPWGLLICLLNFNTGQFFPKTRSRWDKWVRFRQALEIPYFLIDDGHGHSIVFFSGTCGMWYGVLLDFGLVPGQWSWMVPGDTCITSHEYRPGPTIIKSFLEGLPSGLFDINPRETLTLEEVMEEVLRCYSIEEQARCWFRVYRLAPEDGGDEESHFPLSRLEA